MVTPPMAALSAWVLRDGRFDAAMLRRQREALMGYTNLTCRVPTLRTAAPLPTAGAAAIEESVGPAEDALPAGAAGARVLWTPFPPARLPSRKMEEFYRAPLAPYRPRLSFLSRYRVEPDAERAWRRVAAGEIDLTAEVLLDRRPEPDPRGERGKPMLVARLAEDAPERVVAEVTTANPGLLVVTDLHYPGWIAEEEGRRLPLLRADGFFRAVALPAGTHRVVFRYRPLAFYAGAAVSVLALLTCWCSGCGRAGARAGRRERPDAPLQDLGAFGAVIAALVGLLVGSFLNVLIHRLPRDVSIVSPALALPLLRRGGRGPRQRPGPLLDPARRALPLLQGADLRALSRDRARERRPVGPGYWARRAGATSPPARSSAPPAGAARDRRRLPDPAGLDHAAGHRDRARSVLRLGAADAVGAALGAASARASLALAFAYEKIAKQEGMGLGDVKMLAMIGAFLGPAGVLLTLLLASLSGSVVGLGLILAKGGAGKTSFPSASSSRWGRSRRGFSAARCSRAIGRCRQCGRFPREGDRPG